MVRLVLCLALLLGGCFYMCGSVVVMAFTALWFVVWPLGFV